MQVEPGIQDLFCRSKKSQFRANKTAAFSPVCAALAKA